jgi:xanthine/uracil permease
MVSDEPRGIPEDSEPEWASIAVSLITGAVVGAVVASGTSAALLQRIAGGLAIGAFVAVCIYAFFVRFGRTTTWLNERAEREDDPAPPPD